ncbi:hypothetical protein [Azospirillum sp. Sh1]|uniref:hypothetical protein n=1 Tax=Azospirillum sp. Sh1 TaxID=2607285 RepID=UPI0011EC36EC|nr:hypothetical protein [Azospirillum sp. Sh1]KAA0582688.1 hypothetical protein FZ029_00925 [Azospirillum sp. Sh1]
MAGRNVTARFAVEADVAQAKRDLEAVTQQIDQLGKTRVDGARQELEQLNAATGKLAAGYTALTEDQRKLYQQREQDAQQVDKLRRTYKTLEGALETLDVQVKNGWRSMEEAARLQPQLAAAYTRTGQAVRQAGADLQAGAAATKMAAAAQDAAGESAGRLRGVMGNLGYQIQDAAVQAQMGTNAFVIMAQQGPQIAGAFGPAGAAIGAVIAVASVAAGVVFGMGKSAETAETAFTSYAKALEFAAAASEKTRTASEGAKAAVDAEARSVSAAAEARLAKAQAELRALEAAMTFTASGDASANAGAAITYLLKSGDVRALAQEVLILRAALGQYADGARDAVLQTEIGASKLRDARNAIEDYRAGLREQIVELGVEVATFGASSEAKLRAKLEMEALAKAQAAGRTEIDAGTRALIEQVVALQSQVDHLDASKKAMEEAAKAATVLATAQARAGASLFTTEANLDAKIAALKGGEEAMKAYAAEQVRSAARSKAYDDAIRAGLSPLDATAEANRVAAKAAEAYRLELERTEKQRAGSKAESQAEREAKAHEKAIEQADKYIDRLKGETDALGLTERERFVANKAMEFELQNRGKLSGAEMDAYLAKVKEEAGALYDSTEARKAKAKADAEALRALEKYQQDVTRVATDIGKDISENLWDQITGQAKAGDALQFFKNWAKRLAVEMLNQNIVLPITMQIVGSMLSLFGIQAPAGAAGAAGNATGGLTNTVLSKAISWGADKLGLTGGITNAIDKFGYSTLGIGTMVGTQGTMMTTAAGGLAADIGVMPTLGGVSNAAAAGSTTVGGITGGLSGFLGAGAAGLGGGMLGGALGTATNSKAVGGLSGAALGAGASYLGGSLLGIGAMTGGIGLAIAAAVGLITGLLSTQKATVGKTASADVTINSGGKSATFGNILTDNDGDPEVGKALGTALSGIYTIAAMGGGKLTKDFGIGQTAAKGLYVGGSVPYKEFGKGDNAIGDLLRYTLLDQGGLKDGGANTIAALKATKAKDWEEAAKDIGLGASIDAGTTALAALDKSLNSFTKSAKETTAEAMKPMLEEFERAKKLGIDGAYKALATDQLKAYLDQLKNPVDYTQTEQDMASLTGRFQAIREAVTQLNPAMAAYVDQIEAETRARIKASVQNDANRQLNSALGRDYINSINDLVEARDVNARNLTAVGLSTQRATEIYDASLRSLLNGLDSSQLDVVATLFSGSIHDLAVSMRSTSAATVQAAANLRAYNADIAGRVQTALGNDRGAGLIALDAQQAADLAAARANGYDITTLQQVQATERAQQAFRLAQSDLLAAYDQQIAAQQDYVASLTDGAVKMAQSAREFRSAFDALALNDNSPLNAKDRLEEARRQFANALTTYRDDAATADARDAAKQTLLSLGPSLVQLAKGFFGSTSTTDYDHVRSVFAELGDVAAMGVDTADKQLEAANATLKEMQRQRADAAAMGQKQYGALTDLNSIMQQSYVLWQAQLTALQASTGGTTGTPPTYVDSSLAGKRARLEAFTNADIERTFGGFSDIIAARAADPTFNLALWFKTYGLNEVLAGTRKIPGFATGTLSTPPGAVWVGENGPELLWQGGAAAVASSVDSLRIAKAFEAANDRWSGNVTPPRSNTSSAPGMGGIERRLDRAIAVLERVVAAIDAGNDEAVPALKTLVRQAGRSAAPLGRRL